MQHRTKQNYAFLTSFKNARQSVRTGFSPKDSDRRGSYSEKGVDVCFTQKSTGVRGSTAKSSCKKGSATVAIFDPLYVHGANARPGPKAAELCEPFQHPKKVSHATRRGGYG